MGPRRRAWKPHLDVRSKGTGRTFGWKLKVGWRCSPASGPSFALERGAESVRMGRSIWEEMWRASGNR